LILLTALLFIFSFSECSVRGDPFFNSYPTIIAKRFKKLKSTAQLLTVNNQESNYMFCRDQNIFICYCISQIICVFSTNDDINCINHDLSCFSKSWYNVCLKTIFALPTLCKKLYHSELIWLISIKIFSRCKILSGNNVSWNWVFCFRRFEEIMLILRSFVCSADLT